MKRFCVGCIIAAGLTLPGKAAEVDAVKLPDGIYVLNLAKSIIRGAGPVAEILKIEGDKTTSIGFNNAGAQTSLSFNDTVIDGKPHPITGSRFWDSYTATRLDPYTFRTTRFKDGQAGLTSVTIINPKTNTMTTTTIALSGVATNLLVFEKQ